MANEEATLLVELLAEELPPKALKELSEVFASKLFFDLQKDRFLSEGSAASALATPRRLAVLITKAKSRSADTERDVQGPPVSAAPQAVAGFAKKNGVAVEALKKQPGPKGEIYIAHVKLPGQALAETLAPKVEAALKALPIPKVMRWGSGEAQFVRPVHGLVMLHGSKIIPGTVLGLASGNKTRGHRFMGKGEIVIANAGDYEKLLLAGSVVASFEKRESDIDKQLQVEAKKLNASLGEYQALLDEVTALVEFPCVYVGEFDKAFLEVPQECLILTMRQNQKYFPLFDAAGKLTGKFLIVSNMQVADARHIVGGNQRVVRPRLEDARFFYDQDRKVRLDSRIEKLSGVVYHNKLGSQRDRIGRIRTLAGKIALVLKSDVVLAERAAELAKADLLTGMVGEFPELQGIMGRYYALHDKEPPEVADAIEAHYRPRFAGDRLPEGSIACAVALADKLDAIAGLFSIGQQPTGDKDPFGLRRAALGVVRILVENKLPLSITKLAEAAFEPFNAKPAAELIQFVFDRFAGYLKELGFSTLQIESVLSIGPTSLAVVLDQLEAVKAFQALPEAESLAAANKRVLNIIFKNEEIRHKFVEPKRELLTEKAEIALMAAVDRLAPVVNRHYEAGEYKESLRVLAQIKPDVDRFFDEVMVMVDDKALRNNRAALLQKLGLLMNRVADISKLAA